MTLHHDTSPVCSGRADPQGVFIPHSPRLMGKAGFAHSGRNRLQVYRCSTCGRTTTRVEEKVSGEQ